MKKYNIKHDLAKLANILLVILSIVIIFGLFSVLFIYPLYYLSKNFQNIYNLAALTVFIILVSVFLVLKLIKVWKLYKKPHAFLIHLFFYFLLPVILILFTVISEALMLRIFFGLFDVMIALLLFVICNIVIIAGLVMLRRVYFNIKKFLVSKSIKI